jgi:hypothetical protein
MTATSKHIPGKRLKTWHRHYRASHGAASLKAFVRGIIAAQVSDSRSAMDHDTAVRWAGGKVAP